MDLRRVELIEKIAGLSSAIVKEKQLYDTACCLISILSGVSSSFQVLSFTKFGCQPSFSGVGGWTVCVSEL